MFWIIVRPNEVEISGQIIKRPDHITVSEWMDRWIPTQNSFRTLLVR